MEKSEGQLVLGIVKEGLIGGERIAGVIENNPLDSHLLENRKFQLQVQDQLLVSTDPKSGHQRSIRTRSRTDGERRGDRTQQIATHTVDPTKKVELGNRYR